MALNTSRRTVTVGERVANRLFWIAVYATALEPSFRVATANDHAVVVKLLE